MANQPLATGAIAPGLFAIRTGIVNAFVVVRDGVAIAIDAGTKPVDLARGLAEIGVQPAQVAAVLLTHSDYDHTGGLGAVPDAARYLSRREEPLIDGRRARALFVHNPRLKAPYHLLDDGAEFEIQGIKVRAIATPGHTPGSMSFLVEGRFLFTGDTLQITGGQARVSRPYISMDRPAHRASMTRLADLEGVELVCTAHFALSRDFDGAMASWRR